MKLTGNNILDLLISLTLIYALLSIFVSTLLEWWNHYKKERATLLKDSILKLLRDPNNLDYGHLFYNHFMINGLKSEASRNPQYISSGMFADVLIDVIAAQSKHEMKVTYDIDSNEKKFNVENPDVQKITELNLLQQFKESLKKMNPSSFNDTLQSFLLRAGGDQDKLKQLIETWFNDYMDRVSGWYKNKQKSKYFGFGLLVAFLLNADSLHLVKVISLDDELRGRLVETAIQVADKYEALPDSLKNNTTNQIEIFRSSVVKQLKTDTANLSAGQIDSVKNTVATQLTRAENMIKKIVMNDSINRIAVGQADSVLAIVSDLNIPVGWSRNSAPLSWFKKSNCKKSKQHSELKISHSNKNAGILNYIEKRNTPSFSSIIYYFFGMLITAIALSFGAPFWFELLLKFVNLRRAGVKPENINPDKSKP